MTTEPLERAHPHSNGNAPPWVHAFAWGAFALITLATIVLYAVYRDTDVWTQWLGDTGWGAWPSGSETHFAERIRPESIFRTPSNTFSNLAYVWVGLYILAYAAWDYRRGENLAAPHAVRDPALMAFFGLFCVFLGFGSGFMHASLASLGHWYDLLGMYGSLAAVLALHWGRWLPSVSLGKRRLPTWPAFALGACGFAYCCALNDARFGVLVIMLTLIGLIGASVAIDALFGSTRKYYRWYALALGSLALGYTIWNLDETNIIAGPDGWFQEHSIWHLLTALSLGFVAIFYRSEVPITSEPAPSPRD